MNLEHYRKEAKRLLRDFSAGVPRAHARANDALGERAVTRFQLSDAQHVVAVEHGYRSWPELKHTAEPLEHHRTDTVIDTGLEYRPGDPVEVHVVAREHSVWVLDDGAAFERAGRPRAWREAADRVRQEYVVNISRRGVISLPVTPDCFPEPVIVRRIGEASLALYQEMLDLQERAYGR